MTKNKNPKLGDDVSVLCVPLLPSLICLGAYQKNVNDETTFPSDLAVYKQSFSF